MTTSVPFEDSAEEPTIRGFLHEPGKGNVDGDGVVLTHGAGSNCQTKLLAGLAGALAERGYSVLRFDLPFRQARKFGPPSPGSAPRDREGLRRAATLLRKRVNGRVFVGGHSYGGRQASLLLAEAPEVADGLILLSYPLHPPRKPTELRTAHFPNLRKPAFFVHGTRDPFGTADEMAAALKLISAGHALLEVEGAGHELLGKNGGNQVLPEIVKEWSRWVEKLKKTG